MQRFSTCLNKLMMFQSLMSKALIKCYWEGIHLHTVYDLTTAVLGWVWKTGLSCSMYCQGTPPREECLWLPAIREPMLCTHRLLHDSLSLQCMATTLLLHYDSNLYCMSQPITWDNILLWVCQVIIQQFAVENLRKTTCFIVFIYVIVLYNLKYIYNSWQCILKCLLTIIFVHCK